MHTSWRRAAVRHLTVIQLMLLLAAASAGCREWHTQGLSPQTLLRESHPSRLRVTRTDRSQVVLEHPSLRGDTLEGFRASAAVSIPLSDVRETAVRRVSAWRTVVLVGSVPLSFLLLVSIACAAGGGCG